MKKCLIIIVSVLVVCAIGLTIFFDAKSRMKEYEVPEMPGVDVVLTDSNFYIKTEEMFDNPREYEGKIIYLEGLVNNTENRLTVCRLIRDNKNKRDIVYGYNCTFKDGATFETDTWLKLYGVLEVATDSLSGDEYLKILVAPGDYEVIDAGQSIIGEIN